MCPRARFRNLLHLYARYIVPQRPRLIAGLDRLPHSRGHKLGVYPHPTDNVQIRLESCEERGLLLEVAARGGGDALEGVDDGEDVHIKTRRRDPQGIMLGMERREKVSDVLLVDVGGAQVRRAELRRSEWRGGRDTVWAC